MRELHSYKYPRPALTVDIVLFGYNGDKLQVLLIKRGLEPFLGQWALPGGFCRENEPTTQAALRELQEEAGIHTTYLQDFGVFDTPNRDPRGWVVSVGFAALVHLDKVETPHGGSDAKDSKWVPLSEVPKLAFDHNLILEKALTHLRNQASQFSISTALLPKAFPLSEIQKLYEEILGRPLDKRNFRKTLLNSNLLEPTGTLSSGPGRPATLYQFTQNPKSPPE
jgi:8-oxo-dGTP diphosphatase